jgi:hypothetical protein
METITSECSHFIALYVYIPRLGNFQNITIKLNVAQGNYFGILLKN